MRTSLEDVAEHRRRIREMEAALPYLVEQTRLEGYTWAEIAAALGISKQACHHKYGSMFPLPRATPATEDGTE